MYLFLCPLYLGTDMGDKRCKDAEKREEPHGCTGSHSDHHLSVISERFQRERERERDHVREGEREGGP